MEENPNVLVDQILKLIAHDLRSPFASMIGVMNLLIDDYYSMTDEERLDFMQELIKSSKSQLNLLDKISLLSRYQRNTISFYKKTVTTNELVKILHDLVARDQTISCTMVNNQFKQTETFEIDIDMLGIVLPMVLDYFLKESAHVDCKIYTSVNASEELIVCLNFSPIKTNNIHKPKDGEESSDQIWLALANKVLGLMAIESTTQISEESLILELCLKSSS